jgi:hypothetical protein
MVGCMHAVMVYLPVLVWVFLDMSFGCICDVGQQCLLAIGVYFVLGSCEML